MSEILITPADGDAASRLYGGTPEPVKGQAIREPKPVSAPAVAEREPTEEERVAARRAGEARGMWPAIDSTYRDADLLGVFNGQDPAAQKAAATELGEIFLDIGAEESDARALANAMRSGKKFTREQAAAGVADLTPEQIAGARRLASRDPRLLAVLRASGAANNPDVVRTLARLSGTVKGSRR